MKHKFKVGDIAITQNCVIAMQNNVEVEVIKPLGIYRTFKSTNGVLEDLECYVVEDCLGNLWSIQEYQLRPKQDKIAFSKFMEKTLEKLT